MLKGQYEEFLQALTKWLIPALSGITVSLATQMKNKKVTLFSASTSIIIGLCMAYALSEPIYHYVSEAWSGTTLAAIGMFGDRISYWFIFTFKFDVIGDTIEGKVKKWLDKF